MPSWTPSRKAPSSPCIPTSRQTGPSSGGCMTRLPERIKASRCSTLQKWPSCAERTFLFSGLAFFHAGRTISRPFPGRIPSAIWQLSTLRSTCTGSLPGRRCAGSGAVTTPVTAASTLKSFRNFFSLRTDHLPPGAGIPVTATRQDSDSFSGREKKTGRNCRKRRPAWTLSWSLTGSL